MTNFSPLKKISFLLIFAFAANQGISQNSSSDHKDFYWYSPLSFIENHGQFDGRNWQDSEILYGIDYNGLSVFFTKKGLTYRFDRFIRNPGRSKERPHEPKRTNTSELISVTWLDANQTVEVVASDKINPYYSYCIKDQTSGEYSSINYIAGYQTLLYKNLYENIDAEYTLHQEKGIKYNLYLHPGADITNIKMKYEGFHTRTENETVEFGLTPDGNIFIKTSLGEITELSPVAYYSDNGQHVPASFMFENDIISFKVENYDNSRPLVIDPWVISPTFNSSNAVWEVETDGAGNIYTIGGETPMKLNKYNSAGTLQWSYSTPWDTAGYWLGTLATDDAGTSYITAGTAPRIQRISTAGAMVWNASGYNASCEYWSITFNCDNSRLIVGGTYVPGIFSFDYSSAVYDINTSNGSVLGFQTFDTVNIGGIGVFPIEIRGISASKNAKYNFLTHTSVGLITQNIGLCPASVPLYKVPNGHTLAYKCENYLPATQNGGGLKAITSNDNFVYTHSGSQIHKRDLATGSLITSVNLPGGSSTTTFGSVVVRNSGLDVDECGNVYAGSGDRIVKFDPNLNILSETITNFTVYDVSVNSNGEVIAVGAVSNNSVTNRNGKIQSVNMTACAQYSPLCCDATICPINPVCSTDPAFNLIANTGGGTWSGTGITNPSNGTFDPSVSGVGTFWVYYTLSCGTDSVLVTVNFCDDLEVCEETSGDFTVSGGTGPYTWQYWAPAQSIPITNQTECQNCGYTWLFGSCLNGMIPVTTCDQPAGWVTYATGTTTNPPPGYPIQVLDNVGNSVTYNNAGEILPCSACPTLTITTSNVVHVACFGGTTGGFTVTTTGGTSPYDYTLMLGATTVATYLNVAGSQNFTGLPAGTYTLNVLDDANCPGTITITINQPTQLVPGNPVVTDASCGASNGSVTISASGGTPGYTYNWNSTPPQSGPTASNLPAGSYIVTITDNNGCSTTAQATVNNQGAPTVTVTGTDAHCGNSDGGATTTVTGGTAPYTYSWDSNPVQTGPDLINVPGGTYSVTVTDNNGCAAVGTVTINDTPAPTVTVTGTDATCGNNDGSAIATAAGGTAPYTYTWNSNPVQTGPNLTNVFGGNYTVTVTDDNGCTATASVIINNIGGPTLTTSTTPALCGQATGTATVNASGGSGTYTYSWDSNPVQTSQTATGLPPGTYNIEVNDGFCSAFASVTVSDSVVVIQVNISNIVDAMCGNPTGSATAVPSNGTSPYTYAWSTNPPQTGDVLQNVNGGTYTVTVTDANSCSGTASVTIGDTPGPTLSVTSTDENCDQCNGTATVTMNGASGMQTYLWSNGQTTASLTGLCSGTYTVTVNDGGCIATASVTIQNTPGPVADFNVHPTTIILGEGAITFTDNSSGNVVTWDWDFGDGSAHGTGSQTSHTYDQSGEYTITLVVTDANGCSDTAYSTVYIKENVTIYIPNSFSPNGDGLNDGFSPVGYNVDPEGFEMFIFNRWGEQIYYTNEWGVITAKEPWNGTLNNSGTYKDAVIDVYVYRITFFDTMGYKKQHLGTVTIVK
jgi:gliding motility-associated-like protein